MRRRLDRDGRAQVWGTTFAYGGKEEPAAQFQGAYRELLERVRREATATVQLPLTAAPVPPLDPAITERMAARRTEEADLLRQLGDARALGAGLEAEVARLKAKSATCPSVCAPRACAYLQAELDAMPAGLMDEKVAAWEAASAEESRLSGLITDLRELMEQDQQLVEHHHRLEAQAAAVAQGAKAATTRTESEIVAQLELAGILKTT